MNKKSKLKEKLRDLKISLRSLRIFPLIAFQDKINFARHLSVTIKSGMPLLDGLRLIKSQSRSRNFVRVIDQVTKDVNNGQSLSQSLENFKDAFGDFFISMVRVGETSGNLSSTLIYLSHELQKQKDISHKIRGALIYPAVIFVATIGITLFLTLFIFPKILPIFVSLKVELPFTTKFIISMLTFFEKYGLYAVGGLFAFSVMVKLTLNFKRVHFVFDRLMLTLPFLSKVIVNVTIANFARSLGVLLKSGMTIIDALEITKGTFHSLIYQREVEQMIGAVRRGESIAKYLGTQPKLFNPMFVGMIEVGESTGNLEENLTYLAEYYESEVDETVRNLTTILEPILLLVMGFLVGFVALSIITPIYKVTQGLKIR